MLLQYELPCADAVNLTSYKSYEQHTVSSSNYTQAKIYSVYLLVSFNTEVMEVFSYKQKLQFFFLISLYRVIKKNSGIFLFNISVNLRYVTMTYALVYVKTLHVLSSPFPCNTSVKAIADAVQWYSHYMPSPSQ